jgi:uncharacterized phiE125 gp8 family phage protein
MHLTEAKLHVKAGGAVDATAAAAFTADDALLTVAISACRHAAETEQWRALVLQTWDLYLDAFPGGNSIPLPLPPLRAVGFVQYTDSSGVSYSFTDFTVDLASEPGQIVLNYGCTWPSATLAPANPVHIRFQCGYLVPFTATAAMDVITAVNHPFADGDRVRLSVSGGTLSTGLAVLTDYFIRDAVAGVSFKLAATSGGVAIDLTTAGTGNMFVGELPASTMVGMKLILSDLYEERGDTVIGRSTNSLPQTIPRAASHWFAMDSARHF